MSWLRTPAVSELELDMATQSGVFSPSDSVSPGPRAYRESDSVKTALPGECVCVCVCVCTLLAC